MKKSLLSALFLVPCMTALLHAREIRVFDEFHPPVDQSNHVWLRTDVLCFRPQEKSVVLTNKPTNLFTTANVTLEPDVKSDFTWDVGARVGFGYVFPSCLWDMALNWTHFNSHMCQCRSTQGDIGLGMFPIWSLSNDILPFDWISLAKMRLDLGLNLLDLDFGRIFSCGTKFFVRVAMGLRSSWINQKFDVRYGGGIFANGLNLADLDSTFGYDSIAMKNNFFGIGPRVGIEPTINLGRGWGLYAGGYGTLQGSFFDVRQKEVYLKTVRYCRDCSPHKARWMVDVMAGFLWKTFCCRERFALTFMLGWEYHRFFKQVELKGDKFGLVSCDRNLSLNGVAFSVCFDF